jgi:hypothetical protein
MKRAAIYLEFGYDFNSSGIFMKTISRKQNHPQRTIGAWEPEVIPTVCQFDLRQFIDMESSLQPVWGTGSRYFFIPQTRRKTIRLCFQKTTELNKYECM